MPFWHGNCWLHGNLAPWLKDAGHTMLYLVIPGKKRPKWWSYAPSRQGLGGYPLISLVPPTTTTGCLHTFNTLGGVLATASSNEQRVTEGACCKWWFYTVRDIILWSILYPPAYRLVFPSFRLVSEPPMASACPFAFQKRISRSSYIWGLCGPPNPNPHLASLRWNPSPAGPY